MLWNFTPVVRKVCLQDFLFILPALQPKFRFGTFDRGLIRLVKIKIFYLEKVFCFGNFAPVARKVSFHEFLPLLAALRSKTPIRYIRPQNMKIVEGNFTHHWCKVPKPER